MFGVDHATKISTKIVRISVSVLCVAHLEVCGNVSTSFDRRLLPGAVFSYQGISIFVEIPCSY